MQGLGLGKLLLGAATLTVGGAVATEAAVTVAQTSQGPVSGTADQVRLEVRQLTETQAGNSSGDQLQVRDQMQTRLQLDASPSPTGAAVQIRTQAENGGQWGPAAGNGTCSGNGSGATASSGPAAGNGNGATAQDRDRSRDGTCDGSCDGTPDQTQDRDQIQARDGTGSGK
jgi:hypothetical protein